MVEVATSAPVASIIIAAHNAAGTIGAALESALAQTVPVEIVVVDDASLDETFATASAVAEEAPNVTLLQLSRNAGPATARNLAMERTTAPWIAVLDADDVMAPDRLDRLVTVAESRGLDFLADDIEKSADRTGNGPRTRLWSDAPIGFLPVDAPTFVRANLSARRGERREMGFLKPVMRRAFLDRHGLSYADLRLGEDYELYARALILGARFELTDACGYLAITRPESLSGHHPTRVHADLMHADDRLLKMSGLTVETRRAIEQHRTEHHKKWVWRKMIDAVRERRLLAVLGCFAAPLPVMLHLSRQLGAEVTARLARQIRGS